MNYSMKRHERRPFSVKTAWPARAMRAANARCFIVDWCLKNERVAYHLAPP